MAELKPCPFCGCKAKKSIWEDKKRDEMWYGVRCSNTRCIGFYLDPQYALETDAEDKWNRRAEDVDQKKA